jgi:D-alanine transaminase
MNTFIQGVTGNPTVFLNGELTPLSEAKISVLDRGFIFGDGIYEVVPIYAGKPFRMDNHLDRLARSLKKLRIESPYTREEWVDLVETLLQTVLQTSAAQTCMVYLHITRGVAKRDHAFPLPAVKPTVFAMVAPMSRPTVAAREQGLTAVSIDDVRWLLCDIKSISLLGNVLAKQAAVDAQVDEVVQFRNDFLTEGASCNIWVVKQGTLYAPPNDNLILEGIRYGLLQELCQQEGIPFVVGPVSRQAVSSADELMMSSATREVLPIVQLDGKPVGLGQPGPIYQKLRRAYDEAIEALTASE